MAPAPPINDHTYWRRRAVQVRYLARKAQDSETVRLMVQVAAAYEKLAAHIEGRTKGEKE